MYKRQNVNSTSPLLLQTGGSERIRITSNNEIGIAGANYGSSGQVLTSGGSGNAVTWSTITSTTINSNADNRIITGSGTANTLNGEANLTFDGSTLLVNGNLSIADKIIHTGDTNCFISFAAADQIVFEGGGHERFRINGTTGRYLFGRDITGRTAHYNNTGVVPIIQIEDDTEASLSVAKFSNNTDSSRIYLQKGRGSTGSAAKVQDGDTLGMIVFNGYNGSGFRNAAQITAEVDGDPATGNLSTDMPGALVFKTSADQTNVPAERLRIDSSGIVTISAGVNNEGLRITGQNNNAVIFTSPSINGSAGYRLNHHPSTNVLRVDTTDQNGTYTGTVASFSSNGLDMADNIKLRLGTSQDLTLYHYGNDAYIDNATGSILFRQGGSEKVRISSSGDITASHSGLAVNIFESTDNHSRLRIKSSDASLAQLEFADQTDADAGEIRYDHGNDRMTFHVGSNVERFSIDSDGELTSTANNNGQIIHSFKNDNTTAGSSAMTVEHWFRFNRSGGGMNASAARIIAGKEREWIGGASNQDGYFAVHTTADETSSEKMRISSGGIMTRPFQPAFSARGNSSPVDSSEGYTGTLSNYMTTMTSNIGSHYKTSGSDIGNFVAPVAGNYFFSAGCLIRSVSYTHLTLPTKA